MDRALVKRFGIVLRKFRVAAGFTQQELAQECRLDRTYISLLERGLRQPSLTTIFLLADAVNKRPDRLVAAIRK